MKPFSEADFAPEENRDVWLTSRMFELFGSPVNLKLSRGTSTTIEGPQLDCLNDLLRDQVQLHALIEAELVKYRDTLIEAGDTDEPLQVAAGDIWRFVKPVLLHIPFHFSSKDRHAFFHFLIDVDGDHGVEIYIKNGRVERIGPIYCQWQEAGWLLAEQQSQPLTCSLSVVVPGTTISVDIPDGWVDKTESYRDSLESWSDIVLLMKLEAPSRRRSLPAQANVVFYLARLPEGISLEDYRLRLSVAYPMRNQDICFQGYGGFVMESRLSKIIVLVVNASVFVHQVSALADLDKYRALWRWYS